MSVVLELVVNLLLLLFTYFQYYYCCHFYGIILIDVNVIIHIFVMDIINACFNVT